MLIQFYLLFPLFLRAIRYVYNRYEAKGRLISLLISGVVYLVLADQLRNIAKIMEWLNIPVLTDAFTTYADRNFLYFFIYFVLGAAAGYPCNTGMNGFIDCAGYTGPCLLFWVCGLLTY